MAFIDKKDPVVLNIKLTSKGRELLSKGQLTFSYYAIGDSEIDYDFNKSSKLSSFYSNILRPVDKNPQLLSFITRNLSGDTFNEINNVPSTPTIIENKVNPIGFFNSTTTEFLTDADHVKQPDAMIVNSGVTGGTLLKINKAPTYVANVNEPEEGDILLVKWSNSGDTTGHTINKTTPTPYIYYKIQSIVSGNLSNDNLVVMVDRDVPDFTSLSLGNSVSGALIYYNHINYTGNSCYATDNVENAIIAFLQNCQCPTVTFPFWNMSIIFTENIVGVKQTDRQFGDYNTNGFGGFVSYIQNQSPVYNKLGVIHYTNNSVANTYGEGFYGDPLNSEDIDKIPTLDIPYIMWHKSSGKTLGVRFKATGNLKYLTGVTKSLNTRYYDLADLLGNVVGKVFYDLKLFVIEDQELLFALSYKSNRSWTLPNYGIDINANVTFGCPDCILSYNVEGISPIQFNGTNGQIVISDIENVQGNPQNGQLILEILSGSTGSTGSTRIYFNQILGDTIIRTQDTLNGFKLSAATYTVKLSDLGSPNCTITKEVIINEPSSVFSFYDVNSTFSNLRHGITIKTFTLSSGDVPTTISLSLGNGSSNAVGTPYGTAYITIASTGTTLTQLNARTESAVANDAVTNWVELSSSGLLISSLSFKGRYVLYVRDATGNTFSDILKSDIIDAQVWSYFIASSTPFVSESQFTPIFGSDSTGNYVIISNYLKTINQSINPIIGDIEVTIYDNGDVPSNWTSTSNDGSLVKLYYDNVSSNGLYDVEVRHKVGYIVAHSLKKTSSP